MSDDLSAVVAELQARLRRVEDILEIHQLFVDYGRLLDKGDFHAYAQLFTEDAELRLGPVARGNGRAEIEEVMTKNLSPGVGSTLHIISSPEVTLSGDEATAEVMWTVARRDDAGNPVVDMVGHHSDDLVRDTDGRWRFRRRRGYVDLPATVRR